MTEVVRYGMGERMCWTLYLRCDCFYLTVVTEYLKRSTRTHCI